MAALPNSRSDRLRYILAIVLSTITLLVWYLFFSPPPRVADDTTESSESSLVENTEIPPELTDETTKTIIQEETLGTSENSTKGVESERLPAVAEEAASNQAIRDDVEKRVTLSNDFMTVELSTDNGSVAKVVVINRTNKQAADLSPAVRSEDFEAYHLQNFVTGRLFFSPDLPSLEGWVPRIEYKLKSSTENEVIFETELQGRSGLVIVEKVYTLNDGFSLGLKVIFKNEAGAKVGVPYYILNGSNIGIEKSERGSFDLKQLSYELGDANETLLGQSFFGSGETFEEYTGSVAWIALDDRFYARILMPGDQTKTDKSVFMKRSYQGPNGNEDFYLSGAMHVLGQGEDAFTLFFLPKNRSVLNDYYEEGGFYFFNLFHQFSFMRILSSVMYWILELINDIFKNYGWSILVMTLLIKLATFPLTHRGMKSMYKMQQLSPKIEAIKAKYKTSPQKMNAEMMILYKKEKVSPLGGCLPMLLPIPIFIALYSLFQNMVELREMPFLWVKDLSLPDTIHTLSFSLPLLGSNINLLPIIMTITAFAQSLLPGSPQRTKTKVGTGPPSIAEGMQKQMNMIKYFFPIMFFFICWNLPSALVFFWTVQNVFSLFQTLYTKKILK